MATKGSSVHRTLKEKIQEMETQSEKSASRIYGFEKKLTGLGEERENCYVSLATNYLPELDAKAVQNTLREVRKNVEEVFRQKQKRRSDLEQLMKENRNENQGLEKEIDLMNTQIEQLSQERNGVFKIISKELQKDTNYAQRDEKAKKAEARLQQDKKRVAEVEKESERKLPVFEKNKLFSYLIKEGYGTAEYQRNGLKKRIDSWVAEKINFKQNKECYDFLKSMPELMKQEVERRQEELDTIVSEMAEMESGAEKRHGLPKIVAQAEKLIGKRKVLITKDKEQDGQYTGYLKERTEIDGKKDSYHIQAVQDIKEFLKGERIANLKSRARQTAGTEDDRIVDRIEAIDAEVRELKDKTKYEMLERNAISEKLSELNRIEKRFRSKGYDRSNSSFSSGFDINNLLTGYLLGRMDSHKIDRTIDSSQHTQREESYHHSSSGYSSSSHSSDSGFGSSIPDSFSSEMGFGGDSGGFSSGSGF